MAIIKNEIPILEYDDSQLSVLMPNHEKLNLQLPKKAVFAFLGDHIDKYANKHNLRIVGESISRVIFARWRDEEEYLISHLVWIPYEKIES